MSRVRNVVHRRWLRLAVAAAVLMATASAAGIYLPMVYARETASWAAQGAGQDVFNLCVILPVMLMSIRRTARGSARAALVLLGLLLYTIYSYFLYAFFVHFNAVFPIYVAVLGLSFYSFVGILLNLEAGRILELLDGKDGRAQSAYLFALGVAFAALWLSSIAPAVASGTTPQDIVDAGLPVNPVHVLDLALVLPAMIMTAVLLWKRRFLGLLLAVPLITFAAAMCAAIAGMMVVMRTRGLPAPGPLIGALSAVAGVAAVLAFDFLRPTMHGAGNPAAPPDSSAFSR